MPALLIWEKLTRGAACVYPTRYAGSSIGNVCLSANPPSIAGTTCVGACGREGRGCRILCGHGGRGCSEPARRRGSINDDAAACMGNGGRKPPGRATSGMSTKSQ